MSRQSSRLFFLRNRPEAVYAHEMSCVECGRGREAGLARQPDGIPKRTEPFRIIPQSQVRKRPPMSEQGQFQFVIRQNQRRPRFEDTLFEKFRLRTWIERPGLE